MIPPGRRRHLSLIFRLPASIPCSVASSFMAAGVEDYADAFDVFAQRSAPVLPDSFFWDRPALVEIVPGLR